MNRFAYIAGRNLRYRAAGTHNRLGALYSAAHLSTQLGRYSTKASELKSVLPKLWVSKMKTVFAWLDVDGDGYIRERDFEVWEKEMTKLFPDMREEQREVLVSNRNAIWNDLMGGKGKGPENKFTEDMYMERLFYFTTQEGSEDKLKKEWGKSFMVMDINKDGVISKSEHRLFFHSCGKPDPIGAIVAFTAIDENMDGLITRDEFVKAGTEFFINFTDETKPSNYMFGPLKF